MSAIFHARLRCATVLVYGPIFTNHFLSSSGTINRNCAFLTMFNVASCGIDVGPMPFMTDHPLVIRSSRSSLSLERLHHMPPSIFKADTCEHPINSHFLNAECIHNRFKPSKVVVFQSNLQGMDNWHMVIEEKTDIVSLGSVYPLTSQELVHPSRTRGICTPSGTLDPQFYIL